MGRSFKRLQRVLELEAQQGYQNKAVVGGIRQFATFWVGQAREEAVDEQDRALIEQIGDLLADYGSLSGPEARKKTLDGLFAQLSKREARVGVTEPVKTKSPPPSQQKRTPPPHKKQKQAAQQKPRSTEPEFVIPDEPKPQPKRKREPVDPDPEGLKQPVTILKGVGPKVSEQLATLGAQSLWELLYTFPRRYDDYTLMRPINKLQYGEQVTIIGTIWETRARRTRSNQVIVESVISDGTATVKVTWFNQKWLLDKLPAGMQIVISGKVDQYLGRLIFNSPEWEPLEMEPLKTRRIVPVYPLTKGLGSNKMRDMMKTAVFHWAPRIPDPLPPNIRDKHNLTRLPEAVEQVHFPDTQDSLHRGRRRLAFDELFLLQLAMQGMRQEWQANPSIPIQADPAVLIRFHNELPFELTGAQKRVIQEINEDMRTATPMNRLLQGDVGSGKTVVAAAALLQVAATNHQAALMVPTEILAEQHYHSLQKMLSPLGVQLGLLTGSTPAAEKERIYAALASGDIQIAIGTHALIQEGVTFKHLALAIVDEQHRFGVDQREALRKKGMAEGTIYHPHLLTMSATPIPRSLALSLYGDLDLSSLDEMPPGRQEIKTRWLPLRDRERAYSFIRRHVQAGRQAYIVYPLVEESDKVAAKAAVEDYGRLQEEVFPDLRVGLIHGRLKASEKESVMRQFYEGEIDVLASTSVIEVGVDVPNSTIMLIEGANRFGLAQLHQFRGRVGRGEHQSFCLLIADGESEVASERLKALEETNDGFVLAEKDLEIRGPGEFFGRRQSGLPELQQASLLDMELLEITQKEARTLFAQDPLLAQPEHQLLKESVAKFWQNAADIS